MVVFPNRYVAPFREEVQGWMAKLTEVSENIALWLEVQATWMYLEAVFAGGDIMKQLPQVHACCRDVEAEIGGNPLLWQWAWSM